MQDFILNVTRQALFLVLAVSAPVLLAALVVGLLISVLQAATQIQEQTLSFVPKVVAVALALAVSASWMGGQLTRFTTALWASIPLVGR
ncbi:MAG: flagellar biosynthesis protein FliQ [Deltaproteobacteria bacterium]|nr:flagellar biosynthesis protein FliQ [Deltaproteobacteria bacterium]